MRFKMRDFSRSSDRRLGRLIKFDELSRNYPIDKHGLKTTRKLRSYTWRCNEMFDQGNSGACVAFAVAHELAAWPSEVRGLTHDFIMKDIYWDAQRIDPWGGGIYPGANPRYEGTSVLAGAKVAVRLGYATEYRWAFSTDEALYGLGHHGPAILGINWSAQMSRPDADGRMRIGGRNIGGHAILAKAVNMKTERVTLLNTWGRAWGLDGECYVTFEDFNTLLHDQGECCFLKRRHTVAQPK